MKLLLPTPGSPTEMRRVSQSFEALLQRKLRLETSPVSIKKFLSVTSIIHQSPLKLYEGQLCLRVKELQTTGTILSFQMVIQE
jgi:predicted HicB family RNase H-like nuclease